MDAPRHDKERTDESDETDVLVEGQQESRHIPEDEDIIQDHQRTKPKCHLRVIVFPPVAIDERNNRNGSKEEGKRYHEQSTDRHDFCRFIVLMREIKEGKQGDPGYRNDDQVLFQGAFHKLDSGSSTVGFLPFMKR